jgi:hypothetical protein
MAQRHLRGAGESEFVGERGCGEHHLQVVDPLPVHIQRHESGAPKAGS